MATPSQRTGSRIYAWTWALPMIVWQGLFFVGPLVFMVAMSFFFVKNYRMQPAFVLDNWTNMLSKPFFWNAYLLTFELAVVSTIVIG
jgi:spermidine/putrescine transport system permease protein